MHIIFHDWTGRYTISSTTLRDVTFFFDGTAGTFLFSRRDGTVRIFFHCYTGERNEEYTALGTKAAVLQDQVLGRTYHVIQTILCVQYQWVLIRNQYILIAGNKSRFFMKHTRK